MSQRPTLSLLRLLEDDDQKVDRNRKFEPRIQMTVDETRRMMERLGIECGRITFKMRATDNPALKRAMEDSVREILDGETDIEIKVALPEKRITPEFHSTGEISKKDLQGILERAEEHSRRNRRGEDEEPGEEVFHLRQGDGTKIIPPALRKLLPHTVNLQAEIGVEREMLKRVLRTRFHGLGKVL